MFRSRVSKLLGIDYPLLQGGMAWVSDAKLAAAVSEAGGIGIIAAGSADASYVREQALLARELTAKPFGINLMLMSPHVEELSELMLELKPALITTGAGSPARFIPAWKEAGITVIPVCASVAHARMVERAGADAVVAEGGEAGGHVGDLSTMSLVPQVVDAVSIPVIAAGGIADGRQMAAAFMLGAEGVQMGTRFLSAYECSIHPTYKEKVLKASDISTITTGKRLGHPVRSLKTPFSRGLMEAEYSEISNEELEAMGVGTLAKAVREGNVQEGCFIAGQVAGMVNQEQAAAEIVEEVCTRAAQLLRSAGSWLESH